MKPHQFKIPVNMVLLTGREPIPAFKIQGKQYRLVKANSPFDFLVTLDDKQMFQYIHVPDELKGKPCHEVCKIFRGGKPLTRFHFYCLFCPLKRFLQGKIPELIPITTFLLIRDETRSGYWWKNPLASLFMSIVEFFTRF